MSHSIFRESTHCNVIAYKRNILSALAKLFLSQMQNLVSVIGFSVIKEFFSLYVSIKFCLKYKQYQVSHLTLYIDIIALQ